MGDLVAPHHWLHPFQKSSLRLGVACYKSSMQGQCRAKVTKEKEDDLLQ